MHQKKARGKCNYQDSKQNMVSNGTACHEVESKKKTIKKQEHPFHPLQQSHRHKNPIELRHLCEQQEKVILAEYKSKKLESQFYDFVKFQLEGSKICNKILKIREMTNQEALDQLNRLQTLKGRVSLQECTVQYESSKYSYDSEAQESEQEKGMFKQYVKKVSMIQDNDDAYLDELGGVHYSIKQVHEMEDEAEKHEEQPECADFTCHEKQQQYYANDDVFEL